MPANGRTVTFQHDGTEYRIVWHGGHRGMKPGDPGWNEFGVYLDDDELEVFEVGRDPREIPDDELIETVRDHLAEEDG